GVEVDRRAAQEAGVLVGEAAHFGVEAEAGHAEVAKPVRQRDVDGARIAAHGELASGTDVARDAEDSREIVAGAEGDERQRTVGEVELAHGEVERAVAAADD